ncbi:MAG: hypothetical protein ACRENJ_01865 [Candidatus Eiseniibacteriota bacterium]
MSRPGPIRRLAPLIVLATLAPWAASAGGAPGTRVPQRVDRSVATTFDDLPATRSGSLADMRAITDGLLAQLAEFEADVLCGERVTRRLLADRGRTLRYYRHPTLNTGPDVATKTAFETFLTAHGYTGLSWLQRWAITRGEPPGDEPRVPGWVRSAAIGPDR